MVFYQTLRGKIDWSGLPGPHGGKRDQKIKPVADAAPETSSFHSWIYPTSLWASPILSRVGCKRSGMLVHPRALSLPALPISHRTVTHETRYTVYLILVLIDISFREFTSWIITGKIVDDFLLDFLIVCPSYRHPQLSLHLQCHSEPFVFNISKVRFSATCSATTT
jgi:hypothetical protein